MVFYPDFQIVSISSKKVRFLTHYKSEQADFFGYQQFHTGKATGRAAPLGTSHNRHPLSHFWQVDSDDDHDDGNVDDGESKVHSDDDHGDGNTAKNVDGGDDMMKYK